MIGPRVGLFQADRELAYILDDEKFLKQEAEMERMFDSDEDTNIATKQGRKMTERK